jgi:hypothetical protein
VYFVSFVINSLLGAFFGEGNKDAAKYISRFS